MIFHIPHAATEIPAEYRASFLLTNQELQQEILRMTDHSTDELFGGGVGQDDTAVISPISRLVVDMERFADDDTESMSEIGMGVIYESTSSMDVLRVKPSKTQKEHLLQRYYQPHHQALERAVETELSRHGYAQIIDCHSFPSVPLPYERDKESDRPDFCLGVDDFHTNPALAELVVGVLSSKGFSVKVNSPFSGSMVSSKHYLSDERVGSLMIEVNRKLYMNESAGQKAAGFNDIQKLIHEAVASIRAFYPGIRS